MPKKEFVQKTYIRNKIILPFILIMIITSIIFMTSWLHFINQNMEKRLDDEIQKQALFVKKSLEERLRKNIFYSQIMSDMTKIVSEIQDNNVVNSVKSVFFSLSKQDRTITYLSANTLSKKQKTLYKDLLEAGNQGKVKIGLYVIKDDNSLYRFVAAAVTAIKKQGKYYPVISEYPLDNRMLIDIKSKYKSEIAFVYDKNGEFLASTQLFLQNKFIKDSVIKLISDTKNKAKDTFTYNLKINNIFHKISLEKLDLNENVYLVVVARTDEISALKNNLILATILGFLFVTIIMISIYFYIIKRITSSIVLLTEGAQKVAEGDLNHQVFVKTHDEIGELSSFFNYMVRRLKQSTRNLISEKNRSEAIIANLPEGIIVTDSENHIILANQKAEFMFNFSLAEVQDKFILECINNHKLLEILKEQMKTPEKQFNRELKIEQDGIERLYTLSLSLAQSKEGETLGVITVLRDITKERELEELREGFLRTVSHELRTPLTSIIGFLDVITTGAAGKITKKQHEYLGITLKQANNLKTLINDLLDLSRIKAGKMRLIFSDIIVEELFNEIKDQFLPLAKKNKNTIIIDKNIKDLSLIADKEKISRVLINLVSNANKFTKKGNIILSCKKAGKFLEFSVADNGIGLKPEDQEIIFEKFRQADYSATRQFEGIGLGLPIAKELIEMHKGKIWVESIFKKGSSFKFLLPQKKL